jgi:hypothetical protein
VKERTRNAPAVHSAARNVPSDGTLRTA